MLFNAASLASLRSCAFSPACVWRASSSRRLSPFRQVSSFCRDAFSRKVFSRRLFAGRLFGGRFWSGGRRFSGCGAAAGACRLGGGRRAARLRRRSSHAGACRRQPEAQLRRFLVGSRDIALLPLVVGLERLAENLRICLEPIAERVVVVDVQHVAGIGLGQAAMAANDDQVLVVVMRGAEAEIVRAGHHHAIGAERIDHHDLVVNDGEAEFLQLGFPCAEGVARIDAAGRNGG